MVPRYRSEYNDDEDDGFSDQEQLIPPADAKPWMRQIYVDMYLGRGKENPPVTLRLSRLEDDMADVKERQTTQVRLSWAILIALITTLLSVVFHIHI